MLTAQLLSLRSISHIQPATSMSIEAYLFQLSLFYCLRGDICRWQYPYNGIISVRHISIGICFRNNTDVARYSWLVCYFRRHHTYILIFRDIRAFERLMDHLRLNPTSSSPIEPRSQSTAIGILPRVVNDFAHPKTSNLPFLSLEVERPQTSCREIEKSLFFRYLMCLFSDCRPSAFLYFPSAAFLVSAFVFKVSCSFHSDGISDDTSQSQAGQLVQRP